MTVESLPARSTAYVEVLDPMRGIAALAVVLFHYSGSIIPSITPNALTALFDVGRYVVHVFFVISGFVIPFSMYRANYGHAGLGRFMLRRYIRIAPAAYIASLLIILYFVFGEMTLGRPIRSEIWPGINTLSIIGNLLFHPEPMGTLWFNFPYWTLMVEFQFYFLIGLLFPFLTTSHRSWVPAATLLVCLLVTPFDRGHFFHYSAYFIGGTLIFLWRYGFLGRLPFILLLVICLALSAWVDPISSIIAVGAGAVILSGIAFKDRFTTWLGHISYSLYIIHVPVALFAEAVTVKILQIDPEPTWRIVLLFFYTVLALIFAHIFHRIIERPFIRISKKLVHGRTKVSMRQEERT